MAMANIKFSNQSLFWGVWLFVLKAFVQREKIGEVLHHVFKFIRRYNVGFWVTEYRLKTFL